jgi:hypothetical protein
VIDEVITVDDCEAFDTARRVAAEDGVFNGTWLARWGFTDASPAAPVVTAANGYVGVPADATVARELAADRPMLPEHIGRAGTTVVAAEILGSIDLAAIGSLPSEALVRDHLDPVPTLAAVREPVAAVRDRAAANGSPIWRWSATAWRSRSRRDLDDVISVLQSPASSRSSNRKPTLSVT